MKMFLAVQKGATPLLIMKARIMTMAAKFLLSIFIARYMGLETLGLYALLSAAATIVPVFFKAGMHSILMRGAVTQGREELAVQLYHYYFAVGGAYLLALPFVCGAGAYFGLLPLAALVFVIVVLEHLITDWFFLMVSLKKPLRANIMLALQTGAWMLAFMVAAWLFPALRTMENMLLFWLGGGIIALLFAAGIWKDYPWRAVREKGIDRAWYAAQWTKSRLFFLGDIANVGGLYLDRYIIGMFLGLDMTGVYVLFWQMANAVYTLVTTGVLQIYRPRLIESFANETKERFAALYKEGFRKVLLASVGIGLCVAAVAPYLTQYTDKPLAVAHLPLLWFLLAATCVRLASDSVTNALFARHLDRVIVTSTILQCAGSAAFVMAGLSLYGVYGAALGIGMNYIVILAYKYQANKHADTAKA